MTGTDWGLIDPGAADASGTDDDAVLAALVEVEQALLRAWGRVLGEELDAQADALDAFALDRAVLRDGTARDGVPVVTLVLALRAQLEAAGLPAERLHLGATSQDVVDTALMLIAQRTLVAARSALAEAGRGIATLAEAERRSPRIARSLARHAEASTLGVLAAGWLDGVSSAIAAIDAAAFPVQFGGAVGTGAAADVAAGRAGGADVRARRARVHPRGGRPGSLVARRAYAGVRRGRDRDGSRQRARPHRRRRDVPLPRGDRRVATRGRRRLIDDAPQAEPHRRRHDHGRSSGVARAARSRGECHGRG